MGNRYQDLIEGIVTAILKGQVRSKEQIYQRLQSEVEIGTGELFERCLQDRFDAIEQVLATDPDELQQAKATRQQRALKTLQSEWERWQQANQVQAILSQTLARLTSAEPQERLPRLLQALDINQPHPLSRDQVRQLGRQLQTAASPEDAAPSLQDLARGLQGGLDTWQQLQGHAISWIYDQSQPSLGFDNQRQRGPWPHWAQVIKQHPLHSIFADLAQHQTITATGIPHPLSVCDWLALAWVLQRLQLGLVSWFDQQPYDSRAGKRLSIATYLTFAVVWSQLRARLQHLGQSNLVQGCFQMTLQVLYQFAQQDYFPLYGGLFAALSGESLQVLLDYLDQPLKQEPNTAGKARILTLLGYSQRALGRYTVAQQFHHRALDSARQAGDTRCEIANLNHLSRTAVMAEQFQQAIDDSQRALIMARQAGDRLGEANALANYGYSQVCQARQQSLQPQQYESTLTYLQQGLALGQQLGDRPSQALCANSLGMAQVMLGRYDAALESLEQGLRVAHDIGDQFLQGMNYAYMASAYRGLDTLDMAIFTGCLAMYLLHQIDSEHWRQPAGVVSILYGQLGAGRFTDTLANYRSGFLKQIGVDGYDYLPTLLADYRQSLD
ncbi:uncharacterized protein XM38_028950 [Halomicronema hongdechloris C2206]|uniref:Tetratricopeptide repeat domain protein n=1 Tax=Halomicronema hongdechloris C2206 TaxID=1641165 RepID=A0A1Z3HNR0_9CYAN|nr:tetratricopeptide repeat protein [Halomicronema hongdechloris]ASC71941.1 uncharacterized protein XM38_028950 [Halomicronema hongdechloris C2206]